MIIKISGNNIRGGKVPANRDIARILRFRGQGGPLLKVGENQYAIMREGDKLLTIDQRMAALRRSKYVSSRIIDLILQEETSDSLQGSPYSVYCPFKG